MPTTVRVAEADFEAYWSAVEAADEHAAHRVVASVRSRGVPVETVLLDLVVRAQRRVGRLWAANEWQVAREHAATSVSERVVNRLGDALPEPPDGPLLLVACAEREWHALPALIVSQTLRSWGNRVDFLGANASRHQLVSRIADDQPRAVLLSASLGSSLPRVRRQVEAVRGTGTPIVVGGGAFDAAGLRARNLGATAYAASPGAAADVLAGLPRHVPMAPPLRHPAGIEARSVLASVDAIGRDVTAATRAALGLAPSEQGSSRDDWRVVLLGFVPHAVDCLVGALLTDDPTVLEETRAWLTGVLGGRGADATAVDVLWEQLRHRTRDHPEAVGMLRAT